MRRCRPGRHPAGMPRSRDLPVVVGGEPGVRHIQLRQPGVGLGRVRLPGIGQPPPVELGDPLSLWSGGGCARLHGGGQGLEDLVPQCLPCRVLLLGQGQDAGVGPVRLLVSVFLPDLLPESGLIGRDDAALEGLKLLLIGHFRSSFDVVDGPLDSQDQLIQPGPAGLQLCQVALQRRLAVKGRVVQNGPDGGQVQAQLPVEQDVLQPVQLLGAVEAVSGLRGPQGLQQPRLVIPAQGPGRDAGQVRQRLDGVFHGDPSCRFGV